MIAVLYQPWIVSQENNNNTQYNSFYIFNSAMSDVLYRFKQSIQGKKSGF